jgi:hypothetical protein
MISIDSNTNFWVIRAGSSQTYYDHFIDEGIVSVGHWDKYLKINTNIEILNDKVSVDDFKLVKDGLLNALTEDDKKQTVLSGFNQGLRFIQAVKINDIVLTIGKHHISVGKITSNTIQSNELRMALVPSNGAKHMLYRQVSWIRTLPRSGIMPSLITKLIQSPPLTIYDATNHASTILSWIFAYHSFGDSITLSTNILASQDIKSVYKSQYSLLICELELASNIIIKTLNENPSEFARLTRETIKDFKLEDYYSATMSEKAEYMSPGFSWANIKTKCKKTQHILAILFLLTHCEFSAAEVELDKFILDEGISEMYAEDFKKSIKDSVASIGEKFKLGSIKNELQLDIKKQTKSTQEIFVPEPESNPNNKVR